MAPVSESTLLHLVASYGYWAIGGVIALESMGIPVPGETTLVAAAVLSGTTGDLNITGVVGSAAAGAVIGDNIGFWIGRELGFWLVVRYGRYVRLTEPRIKLGQYLFMRHGGKVVFFGRFVAVLRALAAFLAGVNRMGWGRFLLSNAAGGALWAAVYGFGGWYLGQEASRVAGPVGILLAAVALIAVGASVLLFRRHESQLQALAERALPGPLRCPAGHRPPEV